MDAETAAAASGDTISNVASITTEGTAANGANAWATSGGYE